MKVCSSQMQMTALVIAELIICWTKSLPYRDVPKRNVKETLRCTAANVINMAKVNTTDIESIHMFML